MTQRSQVEVELTAGNRLVADLGWAGATVEPSESDPPDIVLQLADGSRIGAEVTRWVRPAHRDAEVLDDQILKRAARTHVRPNGAIVTVQPIPRIASNAPPFEGSDVPMLSRALLALLKDSQLPEAGNPPMEIVLPDTNPLAALWRTVHVTQYEETWARTAYERWVAEVGPDLDQGFDRAVAASWRLAVGRVVVANPGAPGSADAEALGAQIVKKSAALVNWSARVDQRWLLVTANELESVKLWNFRWLDPEASTELAKTLPKHDFDAIAFVPMVAMERFRSFVIYR